ncbi:predicted amino acid aldolase or racemase [Sanguibacter keddieii DSM 10542]|uniref:Predicted amino acid aldolase or racemase n=1 Tax=Sanguibacter keddieii (strain ATCC 51767 / DSM 10542 / NCFB 3025 / ST-74) TaxID=446469 RepID=D1BD68_SANKS|nr:alanine racemase [Sanguibacter keddieii]ACZ23072.1 predicted amino acid aldolase or racemase [Sanguibacter keddieii DSM 10542]
MTPGALGARLDAATAGLPAPLAVVDLDAFDRNAAALVRRAGGTPVRLATKSVRVRALVERAHAVPGVSGLMAYSLREALWLLATSPGAARDVLVAYPCVDLGALTELCCSPEALARTTLVVDCHEHLELVAAARAAAGDPAQDVRLCLDVDASLRVGPGPRPWVHLGVRRSPVHTPEDAALVAGQVAAIPGVRLVGAMFYEAQVAGLPDTSAAVRLVKRLSVRDLDRRRAAVVAAVEQRVGPLELVNSGGTGSVETSVADPTVTEVAAGSGLYAPGLFDGYRALGVAPAAFFGLDVVRRPSDRVVTAFGGGYVASGPPTATRQPRPAEPGAFRLARREGAGEVQTPLEVPRGARAPRVGDRAWFRHAKAGEALERFDVVHLVRGDQVVGTVPTYRGEQQNFG